MLKNVNLNIHLVQLVTTDKSWRTPTMHISILQHQNSVSKIYKLDNYKFIYLKSVDIVNCSWNPKPSTQKKFWESFDCGDMENLLSPLTATTCNLIGYKASTCLPSFTWCLVFIPNDTFKTRQSWRKSRMNLWICYFSQLFHVF